MELGIDLGGTRIKIGIVDSGRVIAQTSLPTEGGENDLERAAASAETLVRETGVQIDALGIAVPGVVDRRRGVMLQAADKYEQLKNVDLRAWGRERFGVPTAVENDARAALIGEITAGSASGEKDAVLIVLGTGIGTAAIMSGVVVRGAHDHAGILGGHVTTAIDGPKCPCGNLGCAEVLASTHALAKEHPEYGGVQGLIEAAKNPEGDGARQELERYLRVWGATIVTMCHMYDPDVVIVTGGVLGAGDVVREPLEAFVDEHLWSSAFRPRFVVPDAPEHSVVRGLAAIAREAAQRIETVGPASVTTKTTPKMQEDNRA